MAAAARPDVNKVISDILCEFLEVAVHQILYIRDLYPSRIFEKRKKYNVPVQHARHPELADYVRSVIEGMRQWLDQGLLTQVQVVITDENDQALERFVFDIEPVLASFSSPCPPAQDVERALRAFLAKISTSDCFLSPNPPGCTFHVLAHVDDSQSQSQTEGREWVPAEPQQQDFGAGADVHGLKSLDWGFVKMQCFAQESAAKPR